MSTDSAASAQGHSKINTQKVKTKALAGSGQVAVAVAPIRGPPGSCEFIFLFFLVDPTLKIGLAKGRSIAAARLLGEGDTSSEYLQSTAQSELIWSSQEVAEM